jgi:hypothetical protein
MRLPLTFPALLPVISPSNPSALPILLLGYIHVGMSMPMIFAFTTIFFYRCLLYGFYRGPVAGSTFIITGCPGFSALAYLEMGRMGMAILPIWTPITAAQAEIIYFATVPLGDSPRSTGTPLIQRAAISFFGLALFFYIFALVPWLWYFKAHLRLNPAGGWATLFPSSGFINVAVLLGDLFNAPAFYYFQGEWPTSGS